MFCANCGIKLLPNTTYCHNCGEKVKYLEPDYRKLDPKDIINKYLTTNHDDFPDIYRFSHYKLAEFRCMLNSLNRAGVTADYSIERKSRVDKEFGYYQTAKLGKKADFSNLGNYIAVDTETTGLRPNSDRIIELSAIKFVEYKPVELFSTYINPKKRVPNTVIELTGIDNEMLQYEPTFPQIQKSFSDYIKDSTLILHNARFDLAFLHYSGLAINTESQRVFDTLELSKKYLKDTSGNKYSSYSLDVVCSHRNIWIAEAHSSAADALASGLLFNEIIKEVSGETDLTRWRSKI